MSTISGSVSGSSPCSRDRSMIWATRSVSRADSTPIRLANFRHRLRVVGCVLDGLGEQRDRPDRCLQLMADVGHEVPTDLFGPPGGGLVVGQDQDQTLVQRRHLHDEVRGRYAGPAGQPELSGDPRLVTADEPNVLQQLGRRDPAAADQAEGPSGARGLQDLVVRADHNSGGTEHRQHLGDPARHPRHLGLEERRWLRRGGSEHQPHDQRAEDQADDERNDGGPDRVHEMIVGAYLRFRGQLIMLPAEEFGERLALVHGSFIPSTARCRAGAYGGRALC